MFLSKKYHFQFIKSYITNLVNLFKYLNVRLLGGIVMEIKKNFIYMLSTFLKRMSKSYTATASLCGYGVEEMPESMKKLR